MRLQPLGHPSAGGVHYSGAACTDNLGGVRRFALRVFALICYDPPTAEEHHMIVRESSDGSLILIAQTDHAKVSGQCAAHWGNGDFARLRPYESVVRAAMFHDSGWYDYEANPSIAPDTGRPLNFLQVVWGKPQRRAYEWAIDWMTRIDPYSGLLVSKHRTGLQRGRYGKMAHPQAFNTQNLPEDNEDFLARNEAAQAAQLKNYDEAEFWTNYQLVQTFDFISLFLCNKDAIDDYIEPVPTAYDAGATPVRLTIKTIASNRVEIDPFPFDVDPLRVQLIRRQMRQKSFPDPAAFRAAYFQCVPEAVDFLFCSRSR